MTDPDMERLARWLEPVPETHTDGFSFWRPNCYAAGFRSPGGIWETDDGYFVSYWPRDLLSPELVGPMLEALARRVNITVDHGDSMEWDVTVWTTNEGDCDESRLDEFVTGEDLPAAVYEAAKKAMEAEE